jgi:large repetitive protein
MGDRWTEPTESFFLNLSNVNNAVIADNQGQATILDNESTTNPGIDVFAIRTEGTFTMNGSGDLDGDSLNLSDDAFVYAAKGFTINGNPTLPVKRDAAGNVIKDASGKPILLSNAVAVSPGYTVANAPTNKFSGFNPPSVVPLQTIEIPAYADLRNQVLGDRIPVGTPEVIFDASRNTLNSQADWNSKFPTGGTATQPRVVRVTNGGLNIPSGVMLSNTIITVERGDINFNGSGQMFTNVTLVANSGNINLNNVNATNLNALASGTVNMNGSAQFSGLDNLIATGNGSVTFNGSTRGVTAADQIRVIAQGNVIFNGSTHTRGSFTSTGTFTLNGASTLYGSVAAKGNIVFNGASTVVGAAITTPVSNQAPTDLRLSNTAILENRSSNSLVGLFSTSDQNAADLHTYQFVSGAGSADNAAFSIVGNQLLINASPDFETKSSYSIRVRGTDLGGLSFEKALMISIFDQAEGAG